MSELRVALTGFPNCGKTSLFNSLTGSRQKVANYPGVTVEKKEGDLHLSNGQQVKLIDLPGTYSLRPQSPDEQVACDVLLGRKDWTEQPDLFVVVLDATQLERSLSYVLELKQIEKPLLVVLNMMDLVEKSGFDIDAVKLEKELGLPVVGAIGTRKKGTLALLEKIENFNFEREWKPIASYQDPQNRFKEVERILSLCQTEKKQEVPFSQKVDHILLHPFFGTVFLSLVLLIVFQAVFHWSEAPTEWIEQFIGILSQTVSRWMPQGPLQSLIVNGMIEGVGATVVFLPQILILFFFVLLLEATGYMARAAFLMDRLMGGVGLHGRAFIPLLSSFACAIPGIMATRTIENKRDRLATILIAPLMTCSARLPVYALLIAAFIPNDPVWGPIRLQGLVMFGLYFAGVVSAVAVAFVFKKTILSGAKPPLLLELPDYKWPDPKNLIIGLYERARLFLKRAGTIILSLTVLLWFFSSYPKKPENVPGTSIEYSYAGRMGKSIEPLIQPLGFDWKVGIALIPGFAAREVMVSSLATVYAIETEHQDAEIEVELSDRLKSDWSLVTALSLLIWYIFAPQCFSTLAVTRRETNSWRWPIFMLIYLLGLAYLASYLFVRCATWMGWA